MFNGGDESKILNLEPKQNRMQDSVIDHKEICLQT